jgi:hypothetical protein
LLAQRYRLGPGLLPLPIDLGAFLIRQLADFGVLGRLVLELHEVTAGRVIDATTGRPAIHVKDVRPIAAAAVTALIDGVAALPRAVGKQAFAVFHLQIVRT